MNDFKITVSNETGEPQCYFVFSEAPSVSGSSGSKVWPVVYQSVYPVHGNAKVDFQIIREYQAAVGTLQSGLNSGSKAEVSQIKPITLGKPDEPGETLRLKVEGGSMPTFDSEPLPPSGRPNAFEVHTGRGYTVRDALTGNFFVGLAAPNSRGRSTPLAVIRPEPNQQWNIQPSTIYYVAAGPRMSEGQLVDVNMLGAVQKIDFSKTERAVKVTQWGDGTMTIQKA